MNAKSTQHADKLVNALRRLTMRQQVSTNSKIQSPVQTENPITKTSHVAPRISKRPSRILIPAVRVHNERLQEIEILRFKAPRHL